VPVPADEHRHRYCDGTGLAKAHQGQLFEAASFSVFAGAAVDGRFELRLAGSNIRQDGNPGAYTLARKISREDAASDYPQAWARSVTPQVTTGDSNDG
jgi:hypothetical protein